MKDPHLFSIHSKAKPYFLKLSSMSPNTSPYSKINPFLKPLNEMPVAPHDEKSLHRAINPTCSTTSSCQLQLFLVVLGWRSLDKMKKQRKKRGKNAQKLSVTVCLECSEGKMSYTSS